MNNSREAGLIIVWEVQRLLKKERRKERKKCKRKERESNQKQVVNDERCVRGIHNRRNAASLAAEEESSTALLATHRK